MASLSLSSNRYLIQKCSLFHASLYVTYTGAVPRWLVTTSLWLDAGCRVCHQSSGAWTAILPGKTAASLMTAIVIGRRSSCIFLVAYKPTTWYIAVAEPCKKNAGMMRTASFISFVYTVIASGLISNNMLPFDILHIQPDAAAPLLHCHIHLHRHTVHDETKPVCMQHMVAQY